MSGHLCGRDAVKELCLTGGRMHGLQINHIEKALVNRIVRELPSRERRQGVGVADGRGSVK